MNPYCDEKLQRRVLPLPTTKEWAEGRGEGFAFLLRFMSLTYAVATLPFQIPLLQTAQTALPRLESEFNYGNWNEMEV